MKSQAPVRSRWHRLAIAASVACIGAVAACTAKVDQKAPEDKVAVQKELTAPNRQTRQHWRGPVQIVIDTTRKVGNLSPDQADRLDTIQREVDEDWKGSEATAEKLRSSAAGVIRSGTADSEEFKQAVHEAVQAVEQRIQKRADALEEVHGILKPEQRSLVATALRAKVAERFGTPHECNDKTAHRGEGLKRLASDLMLSKLQVDQLATIKKELMGERKQLHPTREELLALIDGFESDDFRTPLNTFREKKLAILQSRIKDAGQKTNTVLSIFTPEQREILADVILEGPDKVLMGEERTQTQAPAAP